MTVAVRLGGLDDVDAAVSVYARSNLARRHGVWPERSARIEEVSASLRDTATWFLVAEDGLEMVAMASVQPLRADDGMGAVIPDAGFLDLIFVVPERWGQGTGGLILDAVLDAARERGYSRIQLWTHQDDNERAQRLYRSRSFSPTGQTMEDAEGARIGEWARDQTGQV